MMIRLNDEAGTITVVATTDQEKKALVKFSQCASDQCHCAVMKNETAEAAIMFLVKGEAEVAAKMMIAAGTAYRTAAEKIDKLTPLDPELN